MGMGTNPSRPMVHCASNEHCEIAMHLWHDLPVKGDHAME